MDQSAIASVEGGARGVTLDEAFWIAAALDVAPVYQSTPLAYDKRPARWCSKAASKAAETVVMENAWFCLH